MSSPSGSTTAHYALILYNSTSTDQAALFSTYRADQSGTGVGSNMNLIDAALWAQQGLINGLALTKGSITVAAIDGGSSNYTSTVSTIT